MMYGELIKKVLDKGGDTITAAYDIGFEEGKKYIMDQLQKFLEENDKKRD